MVSVYLFVFFVLSHLSLLHSVEEEKRKQPNRSPFLCRKFGIIGFPFTNSADPNCSLLPVNCDKTPPTIQLGWTGGPYEVINISYTGNTTQSTRIKDLSLSDHLTTQKCEFLTSFIFPNSLSIFYEITSPMQTLFKCDRV